MEISVTWPVGICPTANASAAAEEILWVFVNEKKL